MTITAATPLSTKTTKQPKRPPWLSYEDACMLMHLPPDARRAMGNLLHQQAREQAKHDRYVTSFGLDDVEQISGARAARGQYGTGGGRPRHPEPFNDA